MNSDTEEKEPLDIGCCLGVPLLLVGVILSIPYVWVRGAVQLFQEHRFQKEMQRRNKFIAWDALVPKLEQGQGTLILEAQNKMPSRVWWTDDNVPALSPHALPTAEELYEASLSYFFTSDETHPFVEWCFGRYLNPEAGLAHLTDAPRDMMKRVSDFDSLQPFRNEFPKLEAIETVRKR